MINQNKIDSQDRLNFILDKISGTGIKSLDKEEKLFLNSFSTGKEEECNKKLSEKESSSIFISDDGIFKFKMRDVETIEQIKFINGQIIVPDIKLKKRVVKGELNGSILVFSDGNVALDFVKGKYDIFEFVSGLEYELDCFIDDLVNKLNNL
jgi:hypothetical protein